jgi:large subunit ribosomal protein L5
MAKKEEEKKEKKGPGDGTLKPKAEKPKDKEKAAASKSRRPQATAKVEIDEGTEPKGPVPTPRLIEKYRDQVMPALKEKFGYTNPLEVPRLDKIVISMGVGRYAVAGGEGKAKIEQAERELSVIAGQKPVRCLA